MHQPILQHPIHVAHQLVMLDLLSGGRTAFGAGVGRGPGVEAEYETSGLPYDDRGRLLDETINVVSRLLSGESVSYDGEFVNLSDASLVSQA